MEEAGESDMSESMESESQESLQDLEQNAQIYKKLQGQDEIDEDAELDLALNTIKSQADKPV